MPVACLKGSREQGEVSDVAIGRMDGFSFPANLATSVAQCLSRSRVAKPQQRDAPRSAAATSCRSFLVSSWHQDGGMCVKSTPESENATSGSTVQVFRLMPLPLAVLEK